MTREAVVTLCAEYGAETQRQLQAMRAADLPQDEVAAWYDRRGVRLAEQLGYTAEDYHADMARYYG